MRAEWLVVGLTGCGSLADAGYRGEVLLELAGQVVSDGSVSIEHEVGVTLMWSIGGAVEQQAVVARTTFPSRYTLEVYRPPATGGFQSPWGEEWLDVAIGQPVLFEDLDDDGRWDQQAEPVVGGSLDRAIVWVDALRTPELAPGWVPDRTGYHVVQVSREPCVGAELPGLPLEPAGETTDLEVGYYWEAVLDLDCDGVPEWNSGGDPDPFGECGDPGAYLERCDEYRRLVDEPVVAIDYVEELLRDPCLPGACPEVLPALLDAATTDGACNPLEAEFYCGWITNFGADPVVGSALLQALDGDPDLSSCVSAFCPGEVVWLYGEPW
ncbi:MAG: hypothetical protein ABMA64_34770 [Myxococcota bacterium]